jgi:hypothetical protein
VSAPWPVKPEFLREHDCLFRVDRVPRDEEATAFKQRARWQQVWWREQRGFPIGGHRPPSGDVVTASGSKIDEMFGRETGANFLSPLIRRAAEDRLALPEPHQTLDATRLWTDLLSSMPLCFNLFGELRGDLPRLRRAVASLWPDLAGDFFEVKFEWSPGRRDPLYLNNRSAFDAAIVSRTKAGRCVIGIETKYHEDIRRERAPDAERRLPRYREVADIARVFRSGWEDQVIGTERQQLWLDHLLVLSMLQHPTSKWDSGRFVVVYPAANPGVRDAVERYRTLLTSSETFEARTIEDLLAHHVLHSPATEAAFRERYVW